MMAKIKTLFLFLDLDTTAINPTTNTAFNTATNLPHMNALEDPTMPPSFYNMGNSSSTSFSTFNHTSSVHQRSKTTKILQNNGGVLLPINTTFSFVSPPVWNILFSAFGHIFDILLYCDHQQVQFVKSKLNSKRSKLSFFYHGHLKGMEKESYVSIRLEDKTLVSVRSDYNLIQRKYNLPVV